VLVHVLVLGIDARLHRVPTGEVDHNVERARPDRHMLPMAKRRATSIPN
jgi:hypothetical protein